jgi:hypothetical protein
METHAAHAAHSIDHPSAHLLQGLDTEVEGALWAFAPLRSSGSIIGITVGPDGLVTLAGNVVSDAMRDAAGTRAAAVPGVSRVQNSIVSDAAIGVEAAAILQQIADQPLMTDHVDVLARLGVLYVGGTVVAPDRERAEAALDDALVRMAQLPGVLSVIRDVTVVEGSGQEAVMAAAPTPAAGAGPDPAISERLKVWRERAAAAGGS